MSRREEDAFRVFGGFAIVGALMVAVIVLVLAEPASSMI
jgi:hypothetical protein